MLARLLGPEGRGTLALVFLLPELANTLGRLGFDHANAVFAGLDPTGRRALVWQSVAIAGVAGGAMAIAGAGAVALGAPGFPPLVAAPPARFQLALALAPGGLVDGYRKAISPGRNCPFSLALPSVRT